MAGKPEFDPQVVISHEFPQSTYTYTERDAALYALGVGACTKDAVDDKELKYVYHQDGQQAIQVLPTFAALFSLEIQSQLAQLPGLKFDPRLLLHGQQYIEICKPLPPSGSLINRASVAGLHDKGKAAVLEIEVSTYEKESGVLLCMNRLAVYLRGAGGFSKSSQPYSHTKYPPNQSLAYKIPKSQPFAIYEESTQPSQALLYRLSGDYNPLHSDPTVAEVAGFSRPILHGLCTLGFAVRAIIKSICRGDQSMIVNISAVTYKQKGRFCRILYEVKVKERNKAVLSGVVTLNRFSSSL
ncbi:enoyl-CoA hydratase 2 [Striga asiatica]|uniref:Enoyl-CoA hydratase 2 n=1 Tax=Striga asiatica TaxID=4170 RepID=A0A5A7QE36_STRAF|nr:enoyl-CoA hydratase 2 [Striga asiatica]